MKSILSRKGCNSRAGKVPNLSTTEFHGSSEEGEAIPKRRLSTSLFAFKLEWSL